LARREGAYMLPQIGHYYVDCPRVGLKNPRFVNELRDSSVYLSASLPTPHSVGTSSSGFVRASPTGDGTSDYLSDRPVLAVDLLNIEI
jgi:hypothetical protein